MKGKSIMRSLMLYILILMTALLLMAVIGLSLSLIGTAGVPLSRYIINTILVEFFPWWICGIMVLAAYDYPAATLIVAATVPFVNLINKIPSLRVIKELGIFSSSSYVITLLGDSFLPLIAVGLAILFRKRRMNRMLCIVLPYAIALGLTIPLSFSLDIGSLLANALRLAFIFAVYGLDRLYRKLFSALKTKRTAKNT